MAVWEGHPLAQWEGVRKARFAISQDLKHYHAEAVLNQNPWIEKHVRAAIENVSSTICIARSRKGLKYGVDPDHYNFGIREGFRKFPGWMFEVAVSEGVILGNEELGGAVEGFDIAHFDKRANVARLWSLCFGRRAVKGGEQRWRATLAEHPEWAHMAAEVDEANTPGQDAEARKEAPTVVGEIQCGNWALAYRDALKLIAAHKEAGEAGVDLLVYVAPDRDFSKLLSDGTVSFEKMRDNVLKPFAGILPIPIWLVGVDLVHLERDRGEIPKKVRAKMRTRVTVRRAEESLQVD